MDERGLAFYVLFGVIVAALLFGIFIVHYNRQLEARVDEQAQALADDLARISFSAFSQQQPSFSLPTSLGGSEYELSVNENISAFIVHITGGRQADKSYYSVANVVLKVENSSFAAGGIVYFQRIGDNVVVSASPIKAAVENIEQPTTETPPEFYGFAKENQREAAAIAAAYCYVLDNLGYPSTSDNAPLDATGYEQDGENVLVQIGYMGGENLIWVRASGHDNWENVENVSHAWIFTHLENTENVTGSVACPSFENAVKTNWAYTSGQALRYLRGRTWVLADNHVVVIPANAASYAAAATTSVSTYPTWRFEFAYEGQNYVIHYRLMPWWWAENTAGFVFQSEPRLEPVT